MTQKSCAVGMRNAKLGNHLKRKSSDFSKIPKNKPISLEESITMSFSLSQDKTFFQNSEDALQRESKCAKDSGSILPKVQFGDCKRPKRNTLSFVKTMLFRILH